MWRRVAAGLTAVAVLAGVWGVYGWWNRPMPPPLGDITLEEVAAPATVLTIHPQRHCDESVPGFWATGRSSRSVEEVEAWYDDRFGPLLVEATTFLNGRLGLDGPFTVYEDLQVLVRAEASGTFVWVKTYETTSHDCMAGSFDQWDLKNASTYIDCVDNLIIDFWGVRFGPFTAESPPADWSVMTFGEGRSIAHSIEDTSIIYAKDGLDSDWFRYGRGQHICASY